MTQAESSLATASVAAHDDDRAVRFHGTGGLALAGFFGGPLALYYLADRDLRVSKQSELRRRTAAWFIPLSAVWLYFLFSFPPDLISQWIAYLPQTILWWMVVRHLFRDAHAALVQQGALKHSKWRAVRFGFFVFLGLKVLLFAGFLLFDLWLSR